MDLQKAESLCDSMLIFVNSSSQITPKLTLTTGHTCYQETHADVLLRLLSWGFQYGRPGSDLPAELEMVESTSLTTLFML